MDRRLLLLLVIFLIPFVSPQSITVDYPEQIISGEEFSVKIALVDFETGTYDVKIDILMGGLRVSEIFDNEDWKSTYYYVNDVISKDQEKEFLLRVDGAPEEIEMVIKIRSTSGKVRTFEGYAIEITSSFMDDIQEDDEDIEKMPEEIKKNQTQQQEQIVEPLIEKEPQSITPELINLTPKGIKSEDGELSSGRLDEGRYAIYGFLIFSILLVILITIRWKKRRTLE